MKRLISLLVPAVMVALFATVSTPIPAPGTPKPYPTGVKLVVNADGSFENLLSSYLSRDLVALGDVKIVQQNPRWIMQVLAAQYQPRGDYPATLVVSTTIAAPVSYEWLFRDAFKDKLTEEDFRIVRDVFDLDRACRLLSHRIKAGPPHCLEDLCRQIVADFDAEFLRPKRTFYTRLWQPVDANSSVKPDKQNE